MPLMPSPYDDTEVRVAVARMFADMLSDIARRLSHEIVAGSDLNGFADVRDELLERAATIEKETRRG